MPFGISEPTSERMLLHPGLLPYLHVSLPAEPLLASTAVLDVLENFGEHGAFKALLLSSLLEVIIGSGTWGCEKAHGCRDHAAEPKEGLLN